MNVFHDTLQNFNFSKYKQNQVLVQFHRDRKKLYSFVRKCTLNLKDFIYNSYWKVCIKKSRHADTSAHTNS